MKLPVGKLKNVPGETMRFTLPSPKDAPGLLSHAIGLELRGTAENADRVIRVEGDIVGELELPCDRCGEGCRQRISTPFFERFTNLAEETGEDVHRFSGDAIDLLPFVEQAVFLEAPMKNLCKEDCRGLCPVCGTNLNKSVCTCEHRVPDPRLAVLADWLDEGRKEEGGVKDGST